MPKRNPFLWEHFDKCVGTDKLATCIHCNKNLSYRGTVTNLKTHLKIKHHRVYLDFLRDSGSKSTSNCDVKINLEESDATSSRGSDGGGDTKEQSEFIVPTTVFVEARQDRARTVISAKKLTSLKTPIKVQCAKSPLLPEKFRPTCKEIIDKCLVKLIVYDCQPFTIVDDIGFREFVHALNPDYDLPSRNTISSTILPALYEKRKEYLLNYVKENAENVCVTVDCWSSRTTMDQYMGVTAHFFTEDLEMKSVLLQCDILVGSQTGSSIAQELTEIAEAWGLTDKINFLVTNNSSNMSSASRILNWKHFGCFEHKLNLIVQDALNINNETIEKVKKTVSFYKKSDIHNEILMQYQIDNQNIEPRTLIKAIPTRWNTIYLMLERFYSLREAIEATIGTLNVSLPIISDEEWDCIEQMCIMLKPFYEVSNVMSGEKYLTASTAMVLTSSLMSICESLTPSSIFYDPVVDMLGKLKEGLAQRLGDIKDNLIMSLCSLLDPRYKDVAFPDTVSLEQTKEYTLSLMKSLLTDDNTSVVKQEGGSVGKNMSIWGHFDLKMAASKTQKTAESKAKEELDMYLRETVINRNLCPLTWWQAHRYIYPVLFNIFKTRCNILVTSVSCERAFTKAGYIINDRRTRLTTSKVAQIMFLNANKIE